MSCRVMSCHAMLRCVICHSTLYYVMLCHIVLLSHNVPLYVIVQHCMLEVCYIISYDTAVCAAISLCENGQMIQLYHLIVSNKANKDEMISDKNR